MKQVPNCLNFKCILGIYLHTKNSKLQRTTNPKLTKFETGGVNLDWRSRKGNLCILQYCHIQHGSERRPWPQEMAEIKMYNHKLKKNIAVMSSTKQTQPLSAQSPAFYLVYQDQNVWVFFRFLGPAVLLEEQDPVWCWPGCVGTDTLGAEEHQCVAVCQGGVKNLQERSAMLI